MFSNTFKLINIWIICGFTAFMAALLPSHAVFTGNHITPYGPDSFYHVKRILLFLNKGKLLHFDPQVHAPHGGYICWPWGFDSSMAAIASTVKLFFSDLSYLEILVYIPAFWVFINVGLIILICRSLKFNNTLVFFSALIFSLLPLTQDLHQVGRVDHHMVELTFILASLYTGVQFFHSPDSKKYSLVLGVVLGISQAFNPGLFVLQIPLLICCMLMWLFGTWNKGAYALVALGLILSTFLCLLPSVFLYLGYFNYYYLSLFHLYVAACTSIMLLLFLCLERNKKNVFIIIIIILLLSLPILNNTLNGFDFLTGHLPFYSGINEVVPPVTFKHVQIAKYSGLILLLPVSIISIIYIYLKKRDACNLYILVYSIFGTVFMLLQYRLNYYGSFVLFIPLLYAASIIKDHIKINHVVFYSLIFAIIAACLYPSIPELFIHHPIGGSFDYELSRFIYKDMEKECEENPGVVLADYNDGNFIIYHTACSVIGNNMIISPEDINQAYMSYNLMSMPLQEVLKKKWIDYIFVRRNDNIFQRKDRKKLLEMNKGLRSELLFNEKPIKHLELISSYSINDYGHHNSPLAKLYRIIH